MPQEIENLIDGEGFTDDERKEIRDRVKGDVAEPAPVEEAPPPPAPEEPQEEDEAEIESDAEEPQQQAKPKPKWLQRVDQEKKKREAAEKELADFRGKWEAAEKRLSDLAAKVEKPEPAPKEPDKPAIPDPETDAFGHLAGRLGVTENALNQVIQHFEQQRKAQEQQQQFNGVAARWQHELAEYEKAQRPDIRAAMDDLVAKRRKELAFVGNKPEQIESLLSEEGFLIVQSAHEAGRNPAEVFYELALMRGYAPAAVEQKTDGQEKDLKRIAEGQKKVAASSTNGETEIKGLTLEKVLDMNEEDYEKLVAKFGSFNKLAARLSSS